MVMTATTTCVVFNLINDKNQLFSFKVCPARGQMKKKFQRVIDEEVTNPERFNASDGEAIDVNKEKNRQRRHSEGQNHSGLQVERQMQRHARQRCFAFSGEMTSWLRRFEQNEEP